MFLFFTDILNSAMESIKYETIKNQRNDCFSDRYDSADIPKRDEDQKGKYFSNDCFWFHRKMGVKNYLNALYGNQFLSKETHTSF